MRRVLIVLLAFVLVGCGTGSDGSAPEETVAASPTVVETTPVTTEPTVTPTAVVPTINVDAAPPADPQVRSITVGGMGVEYTEPTRCVVDIGVTSRRPTVQESAKAAAASGEAMTAALTEAGVDPNLIQTSEFFVNAYYDIYPEISGYETHLGYRVTMPSVDMVGSVLANAIAAGGDDARAWGVRFEADTTGLLEVARERAWADVEARAASLASLADEPLGLLLDAHEKVLVTSSQGMMQGGEGDSASFDIPVSPGVSGVVVLLTVTYAIGD